MAPIVCLKNPGIDTSDHTGMTAAILAPIKEIQATVNDSMHTFSKSMLHTDTHRFSFKHELIAKCGFWTTKKRYALSIINKEGIPADELMVKGLDVVRTSFPKVFRDFMTEILTSILNDAGKEDIDAKILTLRSNINTFSISDIARPTSVKEISKHIGTDDMVFGEKAKGAPVHVKAAINHNDFIRHYKLDKKYAKITDGQKVKWVYLKANEYRLSEMAFRDNGEDPPEVLAFIEKYIDREKIYDRELVGKLSDFYTALKWGSIPTNVNVNSSKFF